MSRSQKVVLLALGLLVLVFVAAVVHGQGQPDCKGPPKDCASGYAPGDGLKTLGRLFGSASAGAKLPQSPLHVPAGGAVDVAIDASSRSMRTLKLRIASGGRASLRVVNRDSDPDLSDQRDWSDLPRPAKPGEDASTTSFAVSKGGAVLSVRCLPPSPCVLSSD